MTDRKEPGVAFWASAVLVAVLAYPLSFGPACWRVPKSSDESDKLSTWSVLGSAPKPHAPSIYWPLGWIALNGPKPLGDLVCWYATLYRPGIYLPADREGNSWLRP